jgi:hypothetical protein
MNWISFTIYNEIEDKNHVIISRNWKCINEVKLDDSKLNLVIEKMLTDINKLPNKRKHKTNFLFKFQFNNQTVYKAVSIETSAFRFDFRPSIEFVVNILGIEIFKRYK